MKTLRQQLNAKQSELTELSKAKSESLRLKRCHDELLERYTALETTMRQSTSNAEKLRDEIQASNVQVCATRQNCARTCVHVVVCGAPHRVCVRVRGCWCPQCAKLVGSLFDVRAHQLSESVISEVTRDAAFGRLHEAERCVEDLTTLATQWTSDARRLRLESRGPGGSVGVLGFMNPVICNRELSKIPAISSAQASFRGLFTELCELGKTLEGASLSRHTPVTDDAQFTKHTVHHASAAAVAAAVEPTQGKELSKHLEMEMQRLRAEQRLWETERQNHAQRVDELEALVKSKDERIVAIKDKCHNVEARITTMVGLHRPTTPYAWCG